MDLHPTECDCVIYDWKIKFMSNRYMDIVTLSIIRKKRSKIQQSVKWLSMIYLANQILYSTKASQKLLLYYLIWGFFFIVII